MFLLLLLVVSILLRPIINPVAHRQTVWDDYWWQAVTGNNKHGGTKVDARRKRVKRGSSGRISVRFGLKWRGGRDDSYHGAHKTQESTEVGAQLWGSSLQALTMATPHDGGPPVSRKEKMATLSGVRALGLLKGV
jgi:hypothetical protein